MRRLLSLILTVILMLIMPFNILVFATSNTYELEELGLRVTAPSGYSVITRDTPSNDPIFSKLGTTKSELITHFETSNIYFNAISDTYNEEIVVTMMENSLSNFSLLSDTTLNMLASTLVNQYNDYGINVSKYEIYQHSQAKFIRLYFTDTASTVHGLQYYTIYDGKAMNFTMRSYEGSLSSRQAETIKTVVDSITYNNAPPVSNPGENTSSFVYTDTDSGVKFTVPANWKQEEFLKDREMIDVKFVSTKESGCVMIFGSNDLWENTPSSYRMGYSRADINNSTFTKSDIAEMYGTTENKISVVTYNGIQYYKGETTTSSDVYGIDISVTMTQLVYIDNGWMYMFQFSGTSSHKLYPDFESLLNSVQYPTVSYVSEAGSPTGTTSVTDSSNVRSDDNSGMIEIIVLLLIVAVIVVAVVLSRKKSVKKGHKTGNTPIHDTHTPKLPSNPEPTVSCKNCGQTLPLDSEFCHICGTRIDKENI